MKLRNKKTGEIITKIDISQDKESIWILENEPRIYRSLAELNAEWEDYEQKEPLIKDEKIRKAVRAWAGSFNDVDEIKASSDFKEFWIDGYLIEFERPFDEIEREWTYRRTNIAELCGEEE